MVAAGENPATLGQMASAPQPVLLFDAECVLCRRSVQWLIRRDPRGRLRYLPLGSAAAAELCVSRGLPAQGPDSLVFIPDWSDRLAGPLHLRSSGALRAAAALGGWWRTAHLLRLVPRTWRDAVYARVAARRRQGGAAAAEVPFSPSEQARLIGGPGGLPGQARP